jgi:hypothetical protein
MMSRSGPDDIPGKSQKFPRRVLAMSRAGLGGVIAVSQLSPDNVPGGSRQCPGQVSIKFRQGLVVFWM